MFPIKDNIPSRRKPVVTAFLIITCTLIYVYQFLLSDSAFVEFIYKYGFIPGDNRSFFSFSTLSFSIPAYTVITSIFLHGSWFHLLSNMWFLWIFGDNVEDRMGPFFFLIFYILCGILAGLTHMLFNISSMIPTVGASGAIAGVLGAYFKLYPEAKIKTFIPVFIFLPLFINVPASFFIILWFISQVYSGAVHSLSGGGAVGGVAWWAHIGGFIFGLLLHRLFAGKKKKRGHYSSF